MTPRGDARSFLDAIRIVTAGRTYALATPQPDGPKAERPLTLAGEAMRWSYVLRSRERWRDNEQVLLKHQLQAAETLAAFGLDDAAVREIAHAGRVVVRMPFRAEGWGWEGRIFPWEFVLARATKRHRTPATPQLTVMRQLDVAADAQPKPAAPPTDARGAVRVSGAVLFIRSFPGPLATLCGQHDEAERVRASFGLAAGDPRFVELANPTLDELQAACRSMRPTVLHVAGCDTHQGLQALCDLAGPQTPVLRRAPFGAPELQRTAGELLRDEPGVIDGVLLRGASGPPLIVAPQELAAALTARHTQAPLFVGLNLWNSAARIAPLLLPAGALASMGFQDAFDSSLGEYFFEQLYAALSAQRWNVPEAFEAAWAATRRQADLVPGTGIALWARRPLFAPRADERLAVPAPAPKERALAVRARVEPKGEVNYAELHNQAAYASVHSSALFERFELTGPVTEPPTLAHVVVELHCGPEVARYVADVELHEERLSLLGRIMVPLTATLIRSVAEAMMSTLYVHVAANGRTLHRNTYSTRLMPVDQWRDNRTSGPLLPSFVLPRDPAVERAIAAAQRCTRMLRDDPSAGFEGYQTARVEDPGSLDNVDLQVESIWAALLHEWQLGYINPPPTYSRGLDSQRLRTPSGVYACRMGTCIDLALLFSACLELVDIHPVVFLLKGHALPGYWRHSRFRDEFIEVWGASAVGPGDEARSAAPGEQRHKWLVDNHAEVRKYIRDGSLAPIETVRLTEHCSFREARRAGLQALDEPADFESMLDIVSARERQVTPLPIVGR